MKKTNQSLKKDLEEQNEFLESLLRSFNDIKEGRVKKFKLP